MPTSGTRLSILALAMAAWPAAAQPIAAGDTSPDIVPISRDASDHMTVPVRISERGPFRFLIDTGSQNTVLGTALAASLNLIPRARATLIGFAGTQQVDTVELDQLDLGRRSYYGLLAPLLSEADMGADGILGLDSLQGQRVLIDFRKGVIAVNDAKTLGGNAGYEIVVTARRRSGQLIMADARIDGVAVAVVIDTGAETSVGNLALRKALTHHTQSDPTVLYSVTGQRITADVGIARQLVIDDITFANVLIAFADAPPFEAIGLAAKPALFLGMRDLRALNRLAIDFPTRRIFFDVPRGAF
ncbi:MAG: hypothetical protein RIQ99_707 [Pseudomonadota bacterium]|jgi:predicted aspartyl protease